MDTKTMIVTIIASILGSSGLFSLIQSFINKRNIVDKLKDEVAASANANNEKWQSLARDGKRTQLLLLMHIYPHNHEEIMKVAKAYFIELEGNWYLDSLFKQWLKDEGLEPPTWFTDINHNI